MIHLHGLPELADVRPPEQWASAWHSAIWRSILLATSLALQGSRRSPCKVCKAFCSALNYRLAMHTVDVTWDPLDEDAEDALRQGSGTQDGLARPKKRPLAW